MGDLDGVCIVCGAARVVPWWDWDCEDEGEFVECLACGLVANMTAIVPALRPTPIDEDRRLPELARRNA
jgi:Zn ribbon nucleic-acid-binding protein